MKAKHELLQSIRERRQELGLTQREVANRAGYCKDVITNWENGRSVPTFFALMSVLQVLNVTLVLKPNDENS